MYRYDSMICMICFLNHWILMSLTIFWWRHWILSRDLMFKDVKDMHACILLIGWYAVSGAGMWLIVFFFFFFHLLEESLCLDYEIMNHDVFWIFLVKMVKAPKFEVKEEGFEHLQEDLMKLFNLWHASALRIGCRCSVFFY